VAGFYAQGLERLYDAVPANDGTFYFPGRASKGNSDGAIIALDTESLEAEVTKPILPGHTISSLYSAPGTPYLLGTSSLWGGTGTADPAAGSPALFLWDPEERKVVETFQPLVEVTSYYSLVRCGLWVCGLGANEADYHDTKRGRIDWFLWDPEKRETAATGELPLQEVRAHGLVSTPWGYPIGMGLTHEGEGGLIAYDPDCRQFVVVAQHESFRSGKGLFVAKSGSLYYGSGSTLMVLDEWPKPSSWNALSAD
jgi:hypothetical protein